MTMTERKRLRRPGFYARKADRTMIYRALYGWAEGPDPKGDPALNERRRLPEQWSYARSRSVFESLAQKEEKGQMVSNGLFPPRRYEELVQRLDRLRLLDKVSRREDHA